MRTVYELGPFRLDTEARVLTQDGVATTLGARGVAVLATLLRAAAAQMAVAWGFFELWTEQITNSAIAI